MCVYVCVCQTSVHVCMCVCMCVCVCVSVSVSVYACVHADLEAMLGCAVCIVALSTHTNKIVLCSVLR